MLQIIEYFDVKKQDSGDWLVTLERSLASFDQGALLEVRVPTHHSSYLDKIRVFNIVYVFCARNQTKICIIFV